MKSAHTGTGPHTSPTRIRRKDFHRDVLHLSLLSILQIPRIDRTKDRKGFSSERLRLVAFLAFSSQIIHVVSFLMNNWVLLVASGPRRLGVRQSLLWLLLGLSLPKIQLLPCAAGVWGIRDEFQIPLHM